MTALALEWVEKAEEDFRVAQWVQEAPVGSPNAVCFHCQQCAEKYLKAVLAEEQVVFPRTHDLDVLLDLVAQRHPRLEESRNDLKFLKPFSVEARYPGVSADPADATEAIAVTIPFRKAVRDLLRA